MIGPFALGAGGCLVVCVLARCVLPWVSLCVNVRGARPKTHMLVVVLLLRVLVVGGWFVGWGLGSQWRRSLVLWVLQDIMSRPRSGRDENSGQTRA